MGLFTIQGKFMLFLKSRFDCNRAETERCFATQELHTEKKIDT